MENLAQPRGRRHAPVAAQATEDLIFDRLAGTDGWVTERLVFQRRLAYGLRGRLGWPTLYRLVRGVNVVARKPGPEPGAVVVLAHHDTVRASVGADDNASGLAVVLELAKLLGPLTFRHQVVLAAVDLEELGVLGTPSLVRELMAEGPVLGAICLDAVGFTNGPGGQRLPPGLRMAYRTQVRALRARGRPGDFTAIIHDAGAAGLAAGVARGIAHVCCREDAAMLLSVPSGLARLGARCRGLVPGIGELCRSDHRAFWHAGLPAVLVTDTGNYRNHHYHRPTDTPDTLDYDHLRAVVAGCALAVVDTAVLAGPVPHT